MDKSSGLSNSGRLKVMLGWESLDSDGFIYVVGSTSGSLDGNTNAGLNHLFVVKYSSDGAKK